MEEDKIKFYFPSKILKSEDYSPVEALILKDYYRNSFLKLIDKVRIFYKKFYLWIKIGKKHSKRLFIDYYSYNILNHLLTLEDFKSKNITSNEITKIDNKEKDKCVEVTKHMKEEMAIYIARPEQDIVNIIAQVHFMLKALRPEIIEYLIFIPKENYDIIEYMSTNHIDDIKIANFNVDLIPIDLDLLSLEKENNIKEIYIDKNYSCISDFANAVVKLETCFGKIKYKYIKGDLAKKFCDLVGEKEKENNIKLGTDEILGMVVFDRSVDFLTLMTTNNTCEGLIDENIGINLGKIKVKNSLLNTNVPSKIKIDPNKEVPYCLTSDKNPLFCSISCMRHFDALKYINEIKNYYKQLMANNKSSKKIIDDNKAIKEVGNYVGKIQNDLFRAQNLINYVVDLLYEGEHKRYLSNEQPLLSGEIPNNLYLYYEEFLYEKKDLITLIKLMIIESLTQNGISGYQKLKKEMLNIFGFQKIFLFRDLEELGWLKEKQTSLKNIMDFNYAQLFEKFELLNKQYNPSLINDCSYVLNGYCPLSLKIIEKAVYGQWGTILDILKKIPGAIDFPKDESVISNPEKDNNIMLIVFVGGVTYTEIAAIRVLNRLFNEEHLKGRKKKIQFIILTTSILNSKKILENLGKEVKSILNMKMFNDEMTKLDEK